MPEPITGMTIRECAKAWDVTTQRIYQWRKEKRIKCTFNARGQLVVLTKVRPISFVGGRPASLMEGE